MYHYPNYEGHTILSRHVSGASGILDSVRALAAMTMKKGISGLGNPSGEE